ncbi:hypothetical protein M8C21_006294 [Ambrosia artemisiifolia]|uniref:Starch synthase, chloroplastic/amyloplastic n=1 Tax=Ambrosia artemisiifolia TaxID=4212 RepID=A0AAD5BXD1_AMBAR|nr:hypothetical protein M8C21_006294 [Ambrosia artemisiifolia]
MDVVVSIAASSSSVFTASQTKLSHCFCVIRNKKTIINRKFVSDSTKDLLNRSSINHKIRAISVDEVNAVKRESLAGLVNDVDWPSPSDEIPFWKRKFHTRDVNPEIPDNIEKDSELLYVIHVTAEMAPIAKVGGLGDVVTGLARACLLRGHKVDIMLPFYECIQKDDIQELSLMSTYSSYFDGNWIQTNAYSGLVSDIPVILIEPMNQFFKGEDVYGGSYNELEAYLFFSRACLEWMQVTGTQPDIIHVHEWQTGALPLLYWDMYCYLSLQKPRIVLTIHNMEHYGECRQEQLNKCGLDGSLYATIDKAIDDRTIGHNPERLSLLKGAIVYSNSVVTVSATYLNETLCSGWLASALLTNRDKYHGILNGIDTVMWNPASDVFLPANYHAHNTDGKKVCKQYLQRGLGLAFEGRVPLVVCISRLVAQKGLHLIKHAINHIEKHGGQMIVLGKAPDGRVQEEFEALAKLHNKGSTIRILLMYSEELSHMLYAGADMVLVPSIYEPCGLAQMIGMRYGSTSTTYANTKLLYGSFQVPIVRKTGGLADTVFDMDDQSQPEVANGRTLDRAFSYYKEKPIEWAHIVQKVMQIDNSWNKTASKYIDVYNSIRVRW